MVPQVRSRLLMQIQKPDLIFINLCLFLVYQKGKHTCLCLDLVIVWELIVDRVCSCYRLYLCKPVNSTLLSTVAVATHHLVFAQYLLVYLHL